MKILYVDCRRGVCRTERPTHLRLKSAVMPESRFCGIVKMSFVKIRPHSHAEFVAPCARVTGLVIEWATLHQEELLADWIKHAREELQNTAPLE